ncbi:hypothetical protein E6H27_06900 [Candidatus Bathyarchaeota archaeon]|nr:MAG: hypothetical protein E6H27_06900 [Candidatus Bathyarchaeota archaeon]TMI56687.1 MAG: hypothetical protein E6H14_08205 [Candidatus Bathyarchaeota archaeon]
MGKLTKIQIPVLASYSMPFVLLWALVINAILANYHVTGGPLKILFLGAAFPLGFLVGRLIYVKRSHIEILFDDISFRVIKGSKETQTGSWRSFRLVSLVLDQLGKPNLRLYRSLKGEYIDLPISRTNADPQRFRDYVQSLISEVRVKEATPQVVEAA